MFPAKLYLTKLKITYIVLLLMVPAFSLLSQGSWYINGSLQMVSGKYIYDVSTSTYTLYGGISYQTPRWYISTDFSAFTQNSELVSRGADMFLPGGRGQDMNGMHSGERGMMESSSTITSGIGDIYIRAEYTVLTEMPSFPSVSLNGLTKIPVTQSQDIYSTGEFDFGIGMSLRKRFGQYAAFADIGYIALGDPDDYAYRDPITYGFGLGRFFHNGQYSVLAYYQGYSTILSEYNPPRLLSLGFNIRSSAVVIFSLNGSFGLSETSPDFGLSGGITVAL
jgi:hypothetical protein